VLSHYHFSMKRPEVTTAGTPPERGRPDYI
jgi:hypothetical protein